MIKSFFDIINEKSIKNFIEIDNEECRKLFFDFFGRKLYQDYSLIQWQNQIYNLKISTNEHFNKSSYEKFKILFDFLTKSNSVSNFEINTNNNETRYFIINIYIFNLDKFIDELKMTSNIKNFNL